MTQRQCGGGGRGGRGGGVSGIKQGNNIVMLYFGKITGIEDNGGVGAEVSLQVRDAEIWGKD